MSRPKYWPAYYFCTVLGNSHVRKMLEIPLLEFADLSGSNGTTQRLAAISKLGQAAMSPGFFRIRGHGIDISKMFSLSKEFFDLPLEDKLKIASATGNQGYIVKGSERLDAKTPFPENKEALNLRYPLMDLEAFGKEDKEHVWDTFVKFHSVGAVILVCLGEFLGVDARFFAQTHTTTNSSTTFRLLHYPPSEQAPRNNDQEAEEIVAGLHSDYGSLTLLFQKDVGGLQVQPSDSSEFINVSVVNTELVVNIGDLLQLWTDSAFISTRHRVVRPIAERTSRYSIAYFLHPNSDALIEPLTGIKVASDPQRRINEQERIRSLCGDLTGKKFTAEEYLQHRLRNTFY